MEFKRQALIFLIVILAQGAISQGAQLNNTERSPELYAGKSADSWITEVVRLASTIRATEEDYEENLRECGRHGKNRKAPPCIRANNALLAAQSARAEYQSLLNEVSATSLPTDWLKAHFTWVRWGPEWKKE